MISGTPHCSESAIAPKRNDCKSICLTKLCRSVFYSLSRLMIGDILHYNIMSMLELHVYMSDAEHQAHVHWTWSRVIYWNIIVATRGRRCAVVCTRSKASNEWGTINCRNSVMELELGKISPYISPLLAWSINRDVHFILLQAHIPVDFSHETKPLFPEFTTYPYIPAARHVSHRL